MASRLWPSSTSMGCSSNTDATGLGSWGENPVSVFRERLDSIECDPRVARVVIRINTPGGSVTATDIMWRDLNAFRRRTGLPVVACMMDVAAGGGYYLATAANLIVAHPDVGNRRYRLRPERIQFAGPDGPIQYS